MNSQHSLPGSDDIHRVELSNGIVVLARSNPSSPSVAISGYVQAGSLQDSDDQLGLADFTASCLMRGAAQRSFQEIYDALESVGASVGFDSGAHSSGFGGKALSEDLDLLLEVIADSMQRPTFPAEHVERLRAQLLTGLAIRAQDTAQMASLTFDHLVYDGHPYARPEDGFPETVQAIRREHLVEYHRRNFGPQGMVITIVGAIEPEQAIQKVAAHFGGWNNPDQPAPAGLPPLSPLPELRREKVAIAGKYQSDIVMGVAGPPRNAPDYLAASLGNNILGQFGMMGRIGDSVREKAGLAYYASSSLGGGIGPGPWQVSAGVDPANVDKAIDLIMKEIATFTRQPVAADELADSQANYIGRLPLTLETNSGVAGALVNLERYQLGLDYYRRYAGLVKAVTVEDVLHAARHYLDPERLGIAIAGP